MCAQLGSKTLAGRAASLAPRELREGRDPKEAQTWGFFRSSAGCSTMATTLEVMNRAVLTGVPVRVTSVTSNCPRCGRDLDPPPGAAGDDLEPLDALAHVDEHLDPVALHAQA